MKRQKAQKKRLKISTKKLDHYKGIDCLNATHFGMCVLKDGYLYTDKRNVWINALDQRRGKNISAVAVANKNARIAWALLTKKQCYEPAIN